MPYNEGMFNCYTAPAGADLSGKQFYGVSLVNDTANPPGVHVVVGTTLKGIAGILQNNPLPGQAAQVQSTGATKAAISASVVVTGGTTFLQCDVGGTLTPVTTGQIVAQALETIASTPNVMIISVRLMMGNAATA